MKDIHVNDNVIIHKAGDVIPEVVGPVLEDRGNDIITFKMIDKCPCCGAPLNRIDGEADYYCTNPSCKEKLVNGLIHFASKPAYDIDTLGEKVVKDLYELGYITDIPSIFTLKGCYTELVKIPGYGEKSIDKLLDSIEKSKENNLDKLLFGLGIRHCGGKVSKLICKKYGNIDNIMNATLEDIANIPDCGEVIAKSIYEYMHNEYNINLINKLKELGLNMTYIMGDIKVNYFTNKKCVLTGTLSWEELRLRL